MHLKNIKIFSAWLRMLINFHPLWYLMSMHKKKKLHLSLCVLLVCCAFVHLYRLENAMDCIRMFIRFVLLKMDEKFMLKFCMKYVFETIMSKFDIYTMISTKHLQSRYFILHYYLKPYCWPIEVCTIVTMKKHMLMTRAYDP